VPVKSVEPIAPVVAVAPVAQVQSPIQPAQQPPQIEKPKPVEVLKKAESVKVVTKKSTQKVIPKSVLKPSPLENKIKIIEPKSIQKPEENKIKFSINENFNSKNLNEVYSYFSNLFRAKKFENCLKCLAAKDSNNMKELLNINNLQLTVDDFLKVKLKEIWDSYFDENIKKKNIIETEKVAMTAIKDMTFILKNMKKDKAPNDEIKNIEDQIKIQKLDMQDDIFMMSAKLDYFGKIVDSQFLDNRAMLAVEFDYIFPNQIAVKARNFFVSQYNPQNISQMVKQKRFLDPNILKVYLLFSFEKDTAGDWKILFFSRDEFDSTGFENFISKYENNIVDNFSNNDTQNIDENLLDV
jgi:hypothetical protein